MTITDTIIKTIHLMAGMSFFGLSIAFFFYIASSIRTQRVDVMRYALRASFFADGLILFIVIFQNISGAMMVQFNHLSMQTPWIKVAFMVFGVVSILWLLQMIIRIYNYRVIKKDCTKFRGKYCWIAINILMIVLFVMIIHDAVMQQTYLSWI